MSMTISEQTQAYWSRQLAAAPAAAFLPTDHARPSGAITRTATYQAVLPDKLAQALQELAQRQGVDLDTILAAALFTLLYRYSGQEDLLIGFASPAHAREPLDAPLFQDTLVLRANLAGQPSFLELLDRVHATITDARAHADMPFEDLLDALFPSHSWTQHPLFTVLLRHAQQQPGERPSTMPIDLILDLQESAQGLLTRFTYAPDLYEEATIRRVAGHWQTLLAGIVANPGSPLARLPLLTAPERSQLIVEWNAERRPYPVEQCVQQLFEAQVERSPQSVAVLCEGEQLSYRDLNRQANQLAHYLRENGVGPETLVAILAERSISFAVAMLAVFKAGGAYLPLDPVHPEARLRQVIEQSQCSLVLTTTDFTAILSRTLTQMPAETRPRSIDLWNVPLADQPAENLPVFNTPENLAYVIYTSGSTGLPKGAMVEQRGMVNHLYAKIEALDLSAADTVAQTASQCFDISVWQFLAALLVGGRVRIYPDAVQLLQQVDQHRVTILETVPSLLRAMLDSQEREPGDPLKLEALRWLIPTGEALPVDLCRRWLQRYPRIPLLNAYGPTECSDDVTHYVISQEPDEGVKSIPIGRPIPNMQLYVLDRYMEPQPIGVVGDLYVGGIGVGRGYLRDEQRTRAAFGQDPFTPDEAARLYKTGDLARYLPDGNLEFLGRADSQVKLHGFRIELGEIEAALQQHPAVNEAAVVVREEAPGKQRLVAYVSLHPGEAVSTEELKDQVKKRVPVYMVPAAFVQLDRLPLTPNGKLDRKALPAESSRNATAEGYVAPLLPLHRQLAQIWEEVLGVQHIGIKDDFFALGGDSFLALRLFGRIAQVFGKRLPLSTLFAGATIEQIALALGEESPAQERAPLVAVQATGSERPFFFLHGEWRGGALYTREFVRALGPEQPFYLLEPYRFDGLAVPPSFEAMAAAHLETLRKVQPEGPYLLGGYCNGALMAYEMARQLDTQGQRVDLLLLIDADAPARHRRFRRIVARVGSLLHLREETQLSVFLCVQHLYRYLRFSHYRRAKIAELQGVRSPDASEDEPTMEGAAPLLLKLKALFPHVKNLRQNYLNLYDWPASDYAPDLYPGRITFFWTSEEPWRPVGWRPVVQAKPGAVELHTLPGNHITSRTDYLPVLVEHVCSCIRQAQTASRQ